MCGAHLCSCCARRRGACRELMLNPDRLPARTEVAEENGSSVRTMLQFSVLGAQWRLQLAKYAATRQCTSSLQLQGVAIAMQECCCAEWLAAGPAACFL